MNKYMSHKELISWANGSTYFFGLDMARISAVLLAQCFSIEINSDFNVLNLIHPIKVLEGLEILSGTGDEKIFKHSPLKGLYKKHFFSPLFIVNNLSNFLKSKSGQGHFCKAWNEAAEASGISITDETFVKNFSRRVAVDPIHLKSLSNSLTGEWVVFHKHQGKNYYLTLAAHTESDQLIYERAVLACEVNKFPFSPGLA